MIDRDHLGEASAAYALGALTPDEKHAAERHLADCGQCRREVDAFAQVVDVLPLSAPQALPDARVKRRIVAAARGVRTAAPRLSSDGRSAWPAAGWLVAAAALVVAGFAGSAALRQRAHGVAQTTVLQSQIDAQRHEASDAHAIMAAVAGGAYWTPPAAQHDGMRFAILQPPSEKTALLLCTFPKAPNGMLYRVWIIRGGRAHRAAAFHEPGMHMMHLTMPVQRGDVVAFTMEHSDSNSTPGAPFMLRVTLD